MTDELTRQAADLHETLMEFSRVYQFRDRDRIGCHDVSVTQCYALDVLMQRDRCTLNELAAALCLDKSTASRVVAVLERKGYVCRTRHPRDRRAVLLAATAGGQRLHGRIRADLVAERRRILETFPPEVRAAAPELIRRLTQAVRTRSLSETTADGARRTGP